MKTKRLTVNYREGIAKYNNKVVFSLDFEGIRRNISSIEDIARDGGFTHIRWLHLPIGNGNTTCKL